MHMIPFLWHAAGFAVATFAGTILHFVYDWTDGSLLAASFSGVNESTWEHMKLLYWPLLLFALVQRLAFRERKDFWQVKLVGTALGLVLIPVLFYTCNGAFGSSPDWVNIGIFYVSAAAVFLYEWRAFRKDPKNCRQPLLPFWAICLLGAAYAVFTFAPPELPLFCDPATGSYGIGS